MGPAGETAHETTRAKGTYGLALMRPGTQDETKGAMTQIGTRMDTTLTRGSPESRGSP